MVWRSHWEREGSTDAFPFLAPVSVELSVLGAAALVKADRNAGRLEDEDENDEDDEAPIPPSDIVASFGSGS